MKKVLIISYDFPPARTSGVYRPVKFAKYLPKFGWQPYVLTVKNYNTEFIDLSLLDDLPADIGIYRAWSFEPLRIQEAVFRRLYVPNGAGDDMAVESAREIGPVNKVSVFIKNYFLSPLSRLLKNWLYIPDSKIGWLPLAVIKGRRIIRKEGIELIYSTSPYETAHLVAYFLKKLSGLPWAADFRDLWLGNVYKTGLPYSRMKLEKSLERRIIRKADSIVFIGNKMAEIYGRRYPEFAEKYRVIHNGYDETDFEIPDDAERLSELDPGHVNFMNIGTLYEKSGFEHFLEGFSRALDSGNMGDDLRLHFVGDVIPMWRRMLSDRRFHDHIRLHGFKTHAETVRLMMAADILLLMPMNDDKDIASTVVTGRAFEMMRSGKPILMIGRECECADIIGAAGLGIFVPLENIDLIAETIVNLYNNKKNGTLQATPNRDYIRKFERQSLTETLAGLFDALGKQAIDS